VAPSTGPIAGGTVLTISGTNLSGATVQIGGVAATSVTATATSITCTAPTNTAGAKNVVVTNQNGTATKASGFTYLDPPTISGVTPSAGPLAGGTTITISGMSLLGATVKVGGVNATNVVATLTSVTCKTPAGAAGPKDVLVTTAGGATTAPAAFTHMGAPTISTVTPSSGPLAGGTSITIAGTNLTGATVKIGGVSATNVAATATSITCTTPAGSVGAKSVLVTAAGGSVTKPNGFTYSNLWYTVLEQSPNPSVVTDATLRSAILATGHPWRVRDNGTQIEMVLIPPGTFNMGCSGSYLYPWCISNEFPVHAVTLTSAFYIGRYEVTQAQWIARMGSNPSYFVARPENGNTANTNRPVEQVSWNQIAGAGGFLSGTGMRLPTEAEWEYACRAGTTTAFPGFAGLPNGTNEDALVELIAWFYINNGEVGTPTFGTKAVGEKLANGFGLYDMSGNVREWVNDWYDADYYSSSPSTNPTGPATGTGRVLRGGSWNMPTDALRSSYRFGLNSPDDTRKFLGFRVARNPL
jgi:formylglycine-generating enzyme required for sulfatase activity